MQNVNIIKTAINNSKKTSLKYKQVGKRQTADKIYINSIRLKLKYPRTVLCKMKINVTLTSYIYMHAEPSSEHEFHHLQY